MRLHKKMHKGENKLLLSNCIKVWTTLLVSEGPLLTLEIFCQIFSTRINQVGQVLFSKTALCYIVQDCIANLFVSLHINTILIIKVSREVNNRTGWANKFNLPIAQNCPPS